MFVFYPRGILQKLYTLERSSHKKFGKYDGVTYNSAITNTGSVFQWCSGIGKVSIFDGRRFDSQRVYLFIFLFYFHRLT